MTRTPLLPFEIQVDRLLNEAIRSLDPGQEEMFSPACNVWEDDDHFGIEIALPGWDKEDITIHQEHDRLIVSGKMGKSRTQQGEQERSSRIYHLQEVEMGAFSRSFPLPDQLACDQTHAYFRNGLLSIIIPKRDEARPRRILIQG
ncbi:MAG: Hsp20/alpha crystallin family protein [Nitrospirae bacterium]|nr:MAG: Hsp20/alpha crystallin family protein [Nitrospirota bacterium]